MKSKTKIRIQWLTALADFFSFSRSEQRGIFILGTILMALIVVNAVMPSESFSPSVEFDTIDQQLLSFENIWKTHEDSVALARKKRRPSWALLVSMSADSTGKTTQGIDHKNNLVIELNSADTFDFQRLRGIGPAFARRMVNYRSRLGGFYEKEQVLEIFGMDTSRYRAIQDHLRVDRDSLHPLDINHITFKELIKHPYFPFAVAKSVMVYRQKHKGFERKEELLMVEGIDDSVFTRIRPYVMIKP